MYLIPPFKPFRLNIIVWRTNPAIGIHGWHAQSFSLFVIRNIMLLKFLQQIIGIYLFIVFYITRFCKLKNGKPFEIIRGNRIVIILRWIAIQLQEFASVRAIQEDVALGN